MDTPDTTKEFSVTAIFRVTARDAAEALELVQHELAAHAQSPETDLADYRVMSVYERPNRQARS